jgi:hypothetical protein
MHKRKQQKGTKKLRQKESLMSGSPSKIFFVLFVA